jgi:CheY-like chemotaxis protein/molybdopterin converting factor small subunit
LFNTQGHLDLETLQSDVNWAFTLLDAVAEPEERMPLALLGIPIVAGDKPSPKQIDHFVELFFANDPVGAENARRAFNEVAHEPAALASNLREQTTRRAEIENAFHAMGLSEVYDLHSQYEGWDEHIVAHLLQPGTPQESGPLQRLAADLVSVGHTDEVALGFFPAEMHDALQQALTAVRLLAPKVAKPKPPAVPDWIQDTFISSSLDSLRLHTSSGRSIEDSLGDISRYRSQAWQAVQANDIYIHNFSGSDDNHVIIPLNNIIIDPNIWKIYSNTRIKQTSLFSLSRFTNTLFIASIVNMAFIMPWVLGFVGFSYYVIGSLGFVFLATLQFMGKAIVGLVKGNNTNLKTTPAVTIEIPAPWKRFTDGNGTVSLKARTPEQAMEALFEKYPTLRDQLMDSENNLQPHIAIYVNDEQLPITALNQLKDGDVISVIPTVSGASSKRTTKNETEPYYKLWNDEPPRMNADDEELSKTALKTESFKIKTINIDGQEIRYIVVPKLYEKADGSYLSTTSPVIFVRRNPNPLTNRHPSLKNIKLAQESLYRGARAAHWEAVLRAKGEAGDIRRKAYILASAEMRVVFGSASSLTEHDRIDLAKRSYEERRALIAQGNPPPEDSIRNALRSRVSGLNKLLDYQRLVLAEAQRLNDATPEGIAEKARQTATASVVPPSRAEEPATPDDESNFKDFHDEPFTGKQQSLDFKPTPAPATPAGKPKLRIIVVEDDEMVGPLIEGTLDSAGFEVMLVDNRADASALYTAEVNAGRRIDVLLTDNRMPGIAKGKELINQGIELLRELHGLSAGTTFILMSATEPLPDDLRKLGVGYFEKPFTPTNLENLPNAIKSFVDKKGEQTSPAESSPEEPGNRNPSPASAVYWLLHGLRALGVPLSVDMIRLAGIISAPVEAAVLAGAVAFFPAIVQSVLVTFFLVHFVPIFLLHLFHRGPPITLKQIVSPAVAFVFYLSLFILGIRPLPLLIGAATFHASFDMWNLAINHQPETAAESQNVEPKLSNLEHAAKMMNPDAETKAVSRNTGGAMHPPGRPNDRTNEAVMEDLRSKQGYFESLVEAKSSLPRITIDESLSESLQVHAYIVTADLGELVGGYQFKSPTHGYIIVLNSRMSRDVQDEAFFHERREIYWMTTWEYSQPEAHRMAAAEQILKFSERGALTPYHAAWMMNASADDLEAIVQENATERKEKIRKLYQYKQNNDLDWNIARIEEYERTFYDRARTVLMARQVLAAFPQQASKAQVEEYMAAVGGALAALKAQVKPAWEHKGELPAGAYNKPISYALELLNQDQLTGAKELDRSILEALFKALSNPKFDEGGFTREGLGSLFGLLLEMEKNIPLASQAVQDLFDAKMSPADRRQQRREANRRAEAEAAAAKELEYKKLLKDVSDTSLKKEDRMKAINGLAARVRATQSVPELAFLIEKITEHLFEGIPIDSIQSMPFEDAVNALFNNPHLPLSLRIYMIGFMAPHPPTEQEERIARDYMEELRHQPTSTIFPNDSIWLNEILKAQFLGVSIILNLGLKDAGESVDDAEYQRIVRDIMENPLLLEEGGINAALQVGRKTLINGRSSGAAALSTLAHELGHRLLHIPEDNDEVGELVGEYARHAFFARMNWVPEMEAFRSSTQGYHNRVFNSDTPGWARTRHDASVATTEEIFRYYDGLKASSGETGTPPFMTLLAHALQFARTEAKNTPSNLWFNKITGAKSSPEATPQGIEHPVRIPRAQEMTLPDFNGQWPSSGGMFLPYKWYRAPALIVEWGLSLLASVAGVAVSMPGHNPLSVLPAMILAGSASYLILLLLHDAFNPTALQGENGQNVRKMMTESSFVAMAGAAALSGFIAGMPIVMLIGTLATAVLSVTLLIKHYNLNFNGMYKLGMPKKVVAQEMGRLHDAVVEMTHDGTKPAHPGDLNEAADLVEGVPAGEIQAELVTPSAASAEMNSAA